MRYEGDAPQTIDEYIAQFPAPVRELLTTLRRTIHAAAPDAVERISYQMPTFALEGNLVHFAAHSGHIGFYPTPSAIEAFREELAGYQLAKGTVQFPLDTQLPLDLIRRMVEFRVVENLEKASTRRRRRRT